MEGRPGHVHQAQGTYNPISNQWVDAPDGTVAHTAGDRSRQGERDWYNAKTGTYCSGIVDSACQLGQEALVFGLSKDAVN